MITAPDTTKNESEEYVVTEAIEFVTSNLEYPDQNGWTEWAWNVLAEANHVPEVHGDDDRTYVDCLFFLAGIAHLYEMFMVTLQGDDPSFETRISLFSDNRPGISGSELGRYCERESISDVEMIPESEFNLQQIAISEQADFVKRSLRATIGTSQLFAALYTFGVVAQHTDTVDDDDDAYGPADHDSVLNNDITGEKLQAFAWLDQ